MIAVDSPVNQMVQKYIKIKLGKTESIQHQGPFSNASVHLIDCWVGEVAYTNYLCTTKQMFQTFTARKNKI